VAENTNIQAFIIKVTEIPKPGLVVDRPVESTWLEEFLPLAYRLQDGTAASLTGEVKKDGDNVQVMLRLSFSAEFDCSRCAETFLTDCAVKLDAVFAPEIDGEIQIIGAENLNTAALKEIFPYERVTIDLEPIMGQHVAMTLESFPICKEDCAGICAGCATDLNFEKCKCESKPIDPRWERLAVLKNNS
jgi:DUF177 domain-containing protein